VILLSRLFGDDTMFSYEVTERNSHVCSIWSQFAISALYILKYVNDVV